MIEKCKLGISTCKVSQHPRIANEMKPDIIANEMKPGIIQRCQE